jgi:hypothetical protein
VHTLSDQSIRKLFQKVQGETAWPAVVHILSSRTYFKRLWIIQEIVLSSRAQILRGKYYIQWEVFLQAAVLLGCGERLIRPSTHDPLNLDILFQILQIGLRASGGYIKSLSTVLILFPKAQAADAKDYMYGLLGLALSEIFRKGTLYRLLQVCRRSISRFYRILFVAKRKCCTFPLARDGAVFKTDIECPVMG